jgi:hypothetical protein
MAQRTEELIAALAAGQTYEAAAQSVGLCKRTVVRKMKNPKFRRQLREARALVLERTLGLIAEGSVEASVILRHLLLNSSSERIKLGAARILLAAERKLHETEELAADVELLKEQVARLQRIEKRRRDYERPSRN